MAMQYCQVRTSITCLILKSLYCKNKFPVTDEMCEKQCGEFANCIYFGYQRAQTKERGPISATCVCKDGYTMQPKGMRTRDAECG